MLSSNHGLHKIYISARPWNNAAGWWAFPSTREHSGRNIGPVALLLSLPLSLPACTLQVFVNPLLLFSPSLRHFSLLWHHSAPCRHPPYLSHKGRQGRPAPATLCYKCFRLMFQVFRLDVAKVDLRCCICCNDNIRMLQAYVSSV
jgi:hypothetical protein